VVTTSAMLIIDHKNMQIKYRIPVKQIYKMSLSPFFDDIAIFHVREVEMVVKYNKIIYIIMSFIIIHDYLIVFLILINK